MESSKIDIDSSVVSANGDENQEDESTDFSFSLQMYTKQRNRLFDDKYVF